MLPTVRAKVTSNCEYHEALASNYERLIAEAKGRKGRDVDNFKYLLELHTETAKQLRAVLADERPAAIREAMSEPNRVRRVRPPQKLH